LEKTDQQFRSAAAPRRGISLRTAFGLLLAVVVGPAFVVQGGIYYYWFVTNEAHEFQANRELARSLAGTFDAYVRGLVNHETTLSAAMTAKWPVPTGEMNSLFEAAARDYPALNTFTFIGLEGKIIASGDPRLLGIVVKDRPYFKRALGTPEPYVSDLLEGRMDPNPIFIVSKAVYHDGIVVGVITASVNPDRLGEATLKVARSAGGEVSFYDRLGHLVFHNPSQPLTWEERRLSESDTVIKAAQAGQEADGVPRLPHDDEERIGAVVPITDLGWIVGASEPRSVVTRPLLHSLLYLAGINAAVILASLGGAWIISRGVIRSLLGLRAHALAVGEGKFDAAAPADGLITEIRDLATGFNEMAARRARAEEALASAKQEWELTFDTVPDLIAIIDPQHRMVRANRAMAERLGLSTDQCPGQECFQCVHGLGAPPTVCPHALALLDGREHATELYEERLKGYFLVTCTPLRDPQGRLIGTVHVARDITERKRAEEAMRASRERAEEAEAKYRSLVEESLVGVYLIQGGKFIYVNPHMANVFGYTPEEITAAKTVMDLVTPEDRPVVAEKLRQRLTGNVKSTHYSFRALRKDMRVIDVEVIGSSTLFDGKPAVIGSLLDVTERKRTDEALRKTAAELARSNKDLEQFAYVASHDLQEPLRMVSGHLQIVQRLLGDKIEQAAGESMDFALDGAARMQGLIRDLLAYSRVGTQAKPPEPTDARAAAQLAMEYLQMGIEEAGATVTLDPLPTLQAERTQLTQLFQNLIGNAIKYRRPGVPCQVHVSAQPEGELWHFRVSDNGIGIKPENFERIFMIFQRLHTRQEYPGAGIGLAICKKIVERHGGRIWLESTFGEGTTFHFVLPERQT
jgi:PAS domain S-box-containing protein